MGAAVGTLAGSSPAPDAPPLPWKWGDIDPLEAGRRAYRMYFDPVRGGCGSGSYLSILSLLKEKVGYPWTTLPDLMMTHAAAGYGGHGTLCGSLGGASCIINLVAYGEKDHDSTVVSDSQGLPVQRNGDRLQRGGVFVPDAAEQLAGARMKGN